MPLDRLTAFRLTQYHLDALRAIKARDGVPLSEQMRRALDLWIAEKGLGKKKTARKRPRRR